MSNERPWDEPEHPSTEASREAVAVLMAMADWKAPIKHAELVALTGLDNTMVSLALRGLKHRGRVVVEGTGPRAIWCLAHRRQAEAGLHSGASA